MAQGSVEEVVFQEQGVSARIVELKCARGTKMVKKHLAAARARYHRACKERNRPIPEVLQGGPLGEERKDEPEVSDQRSRRERDDP